MRLSWYLAAVAIVVFMASCGASTSITDTSQSWRVVSESAFQASWNNHCESCSFETFPTEPNSTATLGQIYHGSDFNNDVVSMDDLISSDLGESSGLDGAMPEDLCIWYDSSDDMDDLE